MKYDKAWDELRLTLESAADLFEKIPVETVRGWMDDLEDIYE